MSVCSIWSFKIIYTINETLFIFLEYSTQSEILKKLTLERKNPGYNPRTAFPL